MKTYFLFIPFLLFSLCSCNGDDSFTITEKIIIVDSKKEIGFDAVHNIERPYFRVKFQEDATEWEHISGISGFDYEEGYKYVLKIEEKKIKEPLQDQPDTSYRFLELISKTKVAEASE